MSLLPAWVCVPPDEPYPSPACSAGVHRQKWYLQRLWVNHVQHRLFATLDLCGTYQENNSLLKWLTGAAGIRVSPN